MDLHRYSHVVWDFNGTLIDDLDVSVAAVSDMLTKRGRPPMTRQWYYELMEMPIIRYYEKLFDLSEVSFDTLSAEFAEGYARHFALSRPAPGAQQALEMLARAGCRQAVISSFEQGRLLSALRAAGWLGYFDTVLGADNLLAESKIERARAWRRGMQAVRRVLVVGDLVHDWEMAQAVGADCILVSCGHQAFGDLQRCGCPVFASLEEAFSDSQTISGKKHI